MKRMAHVHLLLLLIAVVVYAATAADDNTAANDTSGSLPEEIARVPLCQQKELANAGFILRNNERKIQCQKALKVDDMLANATKRICEEAACIGALQELVTILPPCRYEDWPFQYQTEKLLKSCGRTPPTNTTTIDLPPIDSASAGSGAATASPLAGLVSNETTPSFAPIGISPSASPLPTPTTNTPAPTSSAHSTSLLCVSVLVATVTVVVLFN